jgi:hypothetical protein
MGRIPTTKDKGVAQKQKSKVRKGSLNWLLFFAALTGYNVAWLYHSVLVSDWGMAAFYAFFFALWSYLALREKEIIDADIFRLKKKIRDED